jgi:hypothetical protein
MYNLDVQNFVKLPLGRPRWRKKDVIGSDFGEIGDNGGRRMYLAQNIV